MQLIQDLQANQMSDTKHGGKRPGAGRKANPLGETTTLRVPKSQVVHIRDYLDSLTTNSTTSLEPATQACSSHIAFLGKNLGDVDRIIPLQTTTQMRIAQASDLIAAGFPSPAQDHIEKTLDMNEHLIRNEAATFMVSVASESMQGAGIDKGDELLVDRSIEAKHRDIIVALVDNDFTVKRLMIEAEQRWLKAENPKFRDIHLKDGQELVVWGVVTRIIKKPR